MAENKFDYSTRNKYAKRVLEEWVESGKEIRDKLTDEQKELLHEIEMIGCSSQSRSMMVRKNWNAYLDSLSDKSKASLSGFMKQEFQYAVDLFVPAEYVEDYFAIIDEFVTYQYSSGWGRRSVRSNNPELHYVHAVKLLYTYMSFATYKASVADFIKDNLEPEALDFKRINTGCYGNICIYCFDDVIAARINAGDAAVIDAIKEAILSENNHIVVTTDMIRGVIKGKNTELHELLGKFLIAARLQEGLRQAICEAADCGRADAFLTILDVIEKEKLTRFAAVKRAIATWTGICDPSNMDRITDKMFTEMCVAVKDEKYARELTESNDSILIMIGLWFLGFYEVKNATNRILEMLENATKNQLLTISYYNIALYDNDVKKTVSYEVVTRYKDDLELLAAYMPTYLDDADSFAGMTFHIKGNGSRYKNPTAEYEYEAVDYKEYFETEEEARLHYDIMKNVANSMKKRKEQYSPCIFPWYGVDLKRSDFVLRMAMIAYMLQDDALIDEVCTKISEIDGTYFERSDVLRMLLHDPHTEIQRTALLNALADKAEMSRDHAFYMVNQMELTASDYKQIEGFLKYKSGDIRKNVISLLKKQEDKELQACIERLLASNKETTRLAALDIVKTELEGGMSKEDSKSEDSKSAATKKDAYIKLVKAVDLNILTESEKVLYNEIVKSEDEDDKTSSDQGYGIYDVNAKVELPDLPYNLDEIQEYFSVPAKELDRMIQAIDAVFEDNKTAEYTNCNGDTVLLGNGLFLINYEYKLPFEERYPFPELWVKLYDEHIKTEKNFVNLYFALMKGYDETAIEDVDTYYATEKVLFPYCGSEYKYNDAKHYKPNAYRNDFITVLNIIKSIKKIDIPRDIALACLRYAADLSQEQMWYLEHVEKPTNSFMRQRNPINKAFVKTEKFNHITHNAYKWKSDEEFKEMFYTFRRLDEVYDFQNMSENLYSNRKGQQNYLSALCFIKACTLGLISEDMVYKYIFDELPVDESVNQLAVFTKPNLNRYNIQDLKPFIDCDEEKCTCDRESDFFQLGKKLIERITELILSVELKRGDTETAFSLASFRLSAVYGIETLFDILTALGKSTLDRSTYYYYYSSGTGKKEVLSHLLHICYPDEGDTAEAFAKKVKEKKVSEERVIEVAMYAPQWIDLIEEYLGCKGFKSSSYYFMAHMNERFDDKKKAMIAKFTPLTPEELNDGAFDVDWFKEAYETLGDKMFQKLYKAAKYISDGSKHARARKYADAALGLVSAEDLEKTISDKRNKDLLMSYGILPYKNEEDSLHRYEFIQKFLKESKQFGGQRRASEAKACDMALKNMATVSGYSDSLRLILAMETALVLSNQKYFDGIEVGEYTAKAVVTSDGKAEFELLKAGKKMKSVPAALKKDETILDVKEFVTKLKNQYSRSVKMFENAMEEREEYSYGELVKLCQNPVIKAILERLVFVDDKKSGLLIDFEGAKDDAKLRVAHPFDLYQLDKRKEWQEIFYKKAQEENIKQPFKQVYRELYLKLPEEMEQFDSRMFAGHQLQPKKTLSVLKTRRWIADYEDGLQKVYYKDNIIATIYALADWFSPADAEEPTLEFVSFYDRKTFKAIRIKDIPEIVYSEIMRDVDLAVSLAHAGGVDPETSHSTIEMRAVIATFNMQLFKLDNVKIEGTHAIIKGTHGEYSIHLGSGVIHKIGSHMIHVLPVHSQNRGKIFLPFIDDDPKTAEIISKIILFAQDDKIKDPYIMDQIV